jgi:hypothetical protein
MEEVDDEGDYGPPEEQGGEEITGCILLLTLLTLLGLVMSIQGQL